MPIGQKVLIKIHEDDSGTVVFDSVTVTPFTHISGATTVTAAYKEDFTGTPNDAFTVMVAYPSTGLPGSQTTAYWMGIAKDAVNAKYGNGEAGAPS